MYAITIDPPRQLITAKLSGMFTVRDVERYIAELRKQFLHHRLKSGYLMLIDTTDCSIQPQDVMVALQAHMADFPKASRLAVVTGGSLARMQVRRVMHQPYLRIVTTVGEAHEWLFGDGDEGAPSASPARAAG